MSGAGTRVKKFAILLISKSGFDGMSMVYWIFLKCPPLRHHIGKMPTSLFLDQITLIFLPLPPSISQTMAANQHAIHGPTARELPGGLHPASHVRTPSVFPASAPPSCTPLARLTPHRQLNRPLQRLRARNKGGGYERRRSLGWAERAVE